jgi:hypothetical protein
MKHIKKISVAKADSEGATDFESILSQIFAFVLDIINATGK